MNHTTWNNLNCYSLDLYYSKCLALILFSIFSSSIVSTVRLWHCSYRTAGERVKQKIGHQFKQIKIGKITRWDQASSISHFLILPYLYVLEKKQRDWLHAVIKYSEPGGRCTFEQKSRYFYDRQVMISISVLSIYLRFFLGRMFRSVFISGIAVSVPVSMAVVFLMSSSASWSTSWSWRGLGSRTKWNLGYLSEHVDVVSLLSAIATVSVKHFNIRRIFSIVPFK